VRSIDPADFAMLCKIEIGKCFEPQACCQIGEIPFACPSLNTGSNQPACQNCRAQASQFNLTADCRIGKIDGRFGDFNPVLQIDVSSVALSQVT
jgi:hypothetical protein